MALLGSQEELNRIRNNARMREYQKKNKKKIAEIMKRYRHKKSGFTEEEIEQHKKDRANYARSFNKKKTQV